MREIGRQAKSPSDKFSRSLATARRNHEQEMYAKTKVYSVHEPEVECITKGNAGRRYELGDKVSVAVTSRGGWFVGETSFVGNPTTATR